MEQNKKFDFKEFIESKGFKQKSDSNFEYILENLFPLQLYFENNEYVIPYTPEQQFRTKIPTNKVTAEDSFKTIEESLDINFKNKIIWQKIYF